MERECDIQPSNVLFLLLFCSFICSWIDFLLLFFIVFLYDSTVQWKCLKSSLSLVSLLVEKCMSSMQTGTQMVKLRGGSKGLVRFFYLDEHKSCIRWRPSRKNEKAKSKSHSYCWGYASTVNVLFLLALSITDHNVNLRCGSSIAQKTCWYILGKYQSYLRCCLWRIGLSN